MSAYNPPIEDLPIFDTNAFTNANTGNGALVSEYLQFPIAQGVETFPNGLVGNLTGNASTSSLSTQVVVSALTTDTNCYCCFVVNTGNRGIAIDTTTNGDYRYNPSTNILTVRNLLANTLYAIGTNDLNIATSTITNKIYFNGTSATNNICYMDSTGLTMATGKTITGNLAGNASLITMTSDDTSGNYFIPFTKLSGTGSKSVFIDDTTGPLTYNPSTGTLTCSNIVGTITGSASKVVIGGKTDDFNYKLIFSDEFGSSQNLYIDADDNITYNPSTDTLNVPNILTGSITNNSNLEFYTTSITDFFNFYIGLEDLAMSISKTEIEARGGAKFKGDLTGTSSTSTAITLTSDNSDGNYYIPFSKTTSGSSKSLYINDVSNFLTYNPSTSNLISPKFTCGSLNANSNNDLNIYAGFACRVNFNINNTLIGYISSTGFTMSGSNVFTGDLTGTSSTSSTITLTTDDTSGNYFLTFSKSTAGTSKSLYVDDTTTPLTYNPNLGNLTSKNMIVSNNLQNSYLSAIVNGGNFYIDGDTAGGDIFITAKTSGSKTIIQTESIGVATVCATFENGGITGNLTGTSSKLLLATKDDNVEYYVPFTSANSGGGGDFFIDSGLNIKYNPSTNNLTTTNMIVSYNLQNSYLSALVGGGGFFIDGDTNGGDIIITAKTSTSKTIIRTEGVGGVLTDCATFENGGITGNLNGTSSAITMTSDNSTGTCYIPFTKTSGTGSKTLFIDDITGPLTYNPSTTLLTATSSAVNVSNLTTDGNYYPTFVVGTGSRGIAIDATASADYRYNPSTNTLTARNILGNTLYSIGTTDLNIATATITNKIYFNGTSATNNICYMDSTGLTMATGKTITGNLSGNASKITITSDDGSGAYYIPFLKTSGTGSKDLFFDETPTSLTYIPSLSTLTASKFVGELNGSLTGGVAGAILYQVGDSVSAFTTAGTSGQSLLSAGGGTPTWGIPSKATNLNGGSVGRIPYQTGSGTTDFLTTGTTGQILTSTGTGGIPSWSTNFAGNAATATTSTNANNASQITITTTLTDTNYNIPFTNQGGTGASNLYIDTGLNLTYNPSTDTLSVPAINSGLLKNTGDITLQGGTNTDFLNFNLGSTRYMSISPTEIKARGGAKFVGDLTGQVNDILGADTFTSNVSLSAPNYSRISYFVGTSSFDVILSNSPTPPNGSVVYIVYKIPATGTLYSLVVYDGSVSATTRVNKFIGQNGDTIGGKFIYYSGVGWFSLSGSF